MESFLRSGAAENLLSPGNNPVMYYDPSGHEASKKCKLGDQANYNEQAGIDEGDSGAIPTEKELNDAVSEWAKMEESLANSKRQLDKFNTATVVYDSKTGNYYYGMNGGVQLSGDTLNSSLADLLPKTSLNQYRVGNCAEIDAVNQVMNAGANIENLHMYTINTKLV